MKKKLLKFRKPALFALIALILALPLASFLYYRSAKSSIEFEVTPLINKVRAGEEFDLKVMIKNNSTNPLEKIDLVFNLPDGVVAASGDKSKIQRMRIENIGEGGEHEEIVKFIALPLSVTATLSESTPPPLPEGVQPEPTLPAPITQRDIQASISYAIGNLTANFMQTRTASVGVEDLPFELTLEAPKEVLAGQEFAVVANYKYSGEGDSPDIKLVIDYPTTFTKIQSTPKSDFVENAWVLQKLSNGEMGKVSLKGSVDLPEGSKLAMTARLLIKVAGKDYPILAKIINIAVASSPLSFDVFLNGDKKSYKPGETLNYTLTYKNNTDVTLQNISIKAKLTGVMFDFATLQASNSSFINTTKTITWDSATLPGLQTLLPDSSGSVTFSINVSNSYPIKRLNDKNFTVRVDARIESPTVPALISASKTINSSTLTTKIAGNVLVDAKALYRDADSLILNSGSLPPKVGAPTEFTIHWILTNFSSDVTNVEVRAKLEGGVAFTNKVKGNTTELPVYEKETKEVVWKIGKVFATTGLTGDKLEVIFQVRATPGSEMLGNYMPLLGETRVKATDEFTGEEINTVDVPLTTQLTDDPTVSEGQGKVTF